MCGVGIPATDVCTVALYLPMCKTLLSVADCTNRGDGAFSWDRDSTSSYYHEEASGVAAAQAYIGEYVQPCVP